MRIAGGRTTDEELREEARERKRKSRAKKKLPPPSLPEPVPNRNSDTFRDMGGVTENSEISVEERKAQMAALDQADERRATTKRSSTSGFALKEFIYACKNWLPKITEEADRQEALRIFTKEFGDKKAKAA
jgi:hypothetical protein